MSPYRSTKQKFSRRRWLIALSVAGFLSVWSCGSRGSQHSILPQGSLDVPANGISVGKVIPVGGWALSEEGIESVSIYLDRRYMMDAQLGGSRPDVKNAFPQFPEAGQAGWGAVLDLTKVAPGAHAIEAQVRSKTGGITTYESRVIVQ